MSLRSFNFEMSRSNKMNHVNLKIFLVVLYSFIIVSLNGQQSTDVSFFEQQYATYKTVVQNDGAKVTPDKNALQSSASILFGAYRNLISTQDGTTCALYPTCSSYYRSAVRKHGFIAGGVMTLDRLARCHNFSPERYTIDMSRRKIVDNVE